MILLRDRKEASHDGSESYDHPLPFPESLRRKTGDDLEQINISVTTGRFLVDYFVRILSLQNVGCRRKVIMSYLRKVEMSY